MIKQEERFIAEDFLNDTCSQFNERSEEIKELVGALVNFQSAMKSIGFDSTNPHFKNKYASMKAIVDACREPLAVNDLSITQLPFGNCGIKTILMHTSGQYIAGTLTLPPIKQDPQGFGSAITYARRYSYVSILGLVADEDDDANQASQKETLKSSSNSNGKNEIKENLLAKKLNTLVEQVFQDKVDISAADQFKAWRKANSFPINMQDVTELDYSKMIFKLQDKINAKA